MSKQKIGLSVLILLGCLMPVIGLVGSNTVLAKGTPLKSQGCPTYFSTRLWRTMRIEGKTLKLQPGTMTQVGKIYSGSATCQQFKRRRDNLKPL